MRVHVWDKEREVDVYIEVLGLAALTSVVVAGSAFDYWPQRVRAFGPFRWLTFKRLTRFGESTMFVGLTKIQHQRERFVYRFTPSARKGWRVLAAAGCPTHLWREERPSLDICHAVTVTAREIDGRVTFIGDLHRNFSHVMLLSSEDGYYCLWMVQWDERNLQTVVWGNEWSEFWPAGKLLSLFVRPNDRLVIFDCDGDIGHEPPIWLGSLDDPQTLIQLAWWLHDRDRLREAEGMWMIQAVRQLRNACGVLEEAHALTTTDPVEPRLLEVIARLVAHIRTAVYTNSEVREMRRQGRAISWTSPSRVGSVPIEYTLRHALTLLRAYADELVMLVDSGVLASPDPERRATLTRLAEELDQVAAAHRP
ncbi:MAG: hypothetical protein AAB733_01695 [Patescibacteria group bacterium]